MSHPAELSAADRAFLAGMASGTASWSSLLEQRDVEIAQWRHIAGIWRGLFWGAAVMAAGAVVAVVGLVRAM